MRSFGISWDNGWQFSITLSEVELRLVRDVLEKHPLLGMEITLSQRYEMLLVISEAIAESRRREIEKER